jgi:hypothetical protein
MTHHSAWNLTITSRYDPCDTWHSSVIDGHGMSHTLRPSLYLLPSNALIPYKNSVQGSALQPGFIRTLEFRNKFWYIEKNSTYTSISPANFLPLTWSTEVINFLFVSFSFSQVGVTRNVKKNAYFTSYSMDKRKFGNTGLGDTERSAKLLLNSRRQRYDSAIYIMPTYGCKNNAYNLAVQATNSEHSTTIIPPLLRRTGSLWCTNVTIYERRVVVVTTRTPRVNDNSTMWFLPRYISDESRF